MEVGLPTMNTSLLRTTGTTRINLVKSYIPQTSARIMDLVLLSLGVILNLFIIVVIFSKASMRTATNYYLISLACSNMVILLEPLQEIMRWFFLVDKAMNMDYICLISFDVSVITIAVLKFQLYINVFRQHTFLGKQLQNKLVAIKGISLIWSASIISVAIGLHIYDFYEGDMADIYVWNTFLFIILPFLIFLVLDCLILYNLMIFKAIDGSWRSKELGHCIMLVVITTAFLLIRTPYRVARAINFIWPKMSCCTDSKREILFFIAKSFPAIFSIIYMASSSEFHGAFKKTDT
ncbi:pyrokinin-1 receptor [Lasioglossum baleicum]|uniref:pyrokinin-1 receptor n=1 Tax=Lasioglossum baleicum TaxID=434251 RepID=UPI003FCCE0CE